MSPSQIVDMIVMGIFLSIFFFVRRTYTREQIYGFLGRIAQFTFPAAVITLITMNVIGPLAKPLDLMFFGYSGEEGYAYLLAMWATGDLKAYQNAQILDWFYAGLHGLAFAGIVWNLVSARLSQRWNWLPVLALLASGFDYLENRALLRATANVPDPSVIWNLTLTGRLFTPAKWIFAAATTALMLFGVAWWVVRKVRKSA